MECTGAKQEEHGNGVGKSHGALLLSREVFVCDKISDTMDVIKQKGT